MIKDGEYGVYKGKEYSLIEEKGDILLKSFDPSDIQHGFHPYERNPHIFLKAIQKSDLDTAYEVAVIAKYKGNQFAVVGEDQEKGTIYIFTNDPIIADQLGMEAPGCGEYRLEVKKEEVELKEYKRPILGFD